MSPDLINYKDLVNVNYAGVYTFLRGALKNETTFRHSSWVNYCSSKWQKGFWYVPIKAVLLQLQVYDSNWKQDKYFFNYYNAWEIYE